VGDSKHVKLSPSGGSGAVLDDAHVVAAYARWAPVYDQVFGSFNRSAIRKAVDLINTLPPGRILELGVGTGIALPLYKTEHRVVGIDLSPDMLERARRRVTQEKLKAVEALHEMDAARLTFPDGSFDAATAMFVITVVPQTDRTLAELARVVKPGGKIVIVSHFGEKAGIISAVERGIARFGPSLGWNPGFPVERILNNPDLKLVERRRLGLGFYTLIVFERI
jgi:phosphatidylethanolamine/phosphatidyl-N-methylethanolamine N-methyltransferase